MRLQLQKDPGLAEGGHPGALGEDVRPQRALTATIWIFFLWAIWRRRLTKSLTTLQRS